MNPVATALIAAVIALALFAYKPTLLQDEDGQPKYRYVNKYTAALAIGAVVYGLSLLMQPSTTSSLASQGYYGVGSRRMSKAGTSTLRTRARGYDFPAFTRSRRAPSSSGRMRVPRAPRTSSMSSLPTQFSTPSTDSASTFPAL